MNDFHLADPKLQESILNFCRNPNKLCYVNEDDFYTKEETFNRFKIIFTLYEGQEFHPYLNENCCRIVVENPIDSKDLVKRNLEF
jgi:hypothetical protein